MAIKKAKVVSEDDPTKAAKVAAAEEDVSIYDYERGFLEDADLDDKESCLEVISMSIEPINGRLVDIVIEIKEIESDRVRPWPLPRLTMLSPSRYLRSMRPAVVSPLLVIVDKAQPSPTAPPQRPAPQGIPDDGRIKPSTYLYQNDLARELLQKSQAFPEPMSLRKTAREFFDIAEELDPQGLRSNVAARNPSAEQNAKRRRGDD
ncbi:hypothetical protein IAR50_003231 [Cryptococcus sp. DSM 104548]